jgi:hypothetical protein
MQRALSRGVWVNATAEQAKQFVLDDPFDGFALNPAWRVYSGVKTVGWAPTGLGELKQVIIASGGNSGHWCGLLRPIPTHIKDFTVTLAQTGGTFNSEYGLGIYSPTTGVYLNVSSNAGLWNRVGVAKLTGLLNTQRSSLAGAVQPDLPSAPRYFRIKVLGGNITFHFSTDNVTFTQRGSSYSINTELGPAPWMVGPMTTGFSDTFLWGGITLTQP